MNHLTALLLMAGLTLLSVGTVPGCSTGTQQSPDAPSGVAVSSSTQPSSVPGAQAVPEPAPELAAWCAELQKSIGEHHWKIDACTGLDWKVAGKSIGGRALVYGEFGNISVPNTTLILTMVHGDEVTPLYLGIELAHWMKAHPELLRETHVVIAPLVNPDGYYARPRTRMNARGVDVNRNFPTKDWQTRAVRAWKVQFKSNPRRFPGNEPSSEPETKFQEELIARIRPQKILSVHAPLNFMDYDGPTVLSLARFPREYVRECLKLRTRLKAISGGFFPGSLGNYAGQELGIPTLTLELPTASPQKAPDYWAKFRSGIQTMIEFKVPEYASRTQE